MKFIFFLSLPLYALDQLTKHLVLRTVDPDQPRAVVQGFLDLVNVTNDGAAFGSFKNNNNFFIVISCLAMLFVLVLLLRRRKRDVWRDVSLALLLAGILGNLTDRLLHGHVIDFLLFDLHIPLAHPWPAFNVADSCICIAVFCFIIYSFWQKPEGEVVSAAPPGL
jgi:signal peptidase II